MIEKDILLKEHRNNKSGVYCLFNIINGKFYLGCSINLNGRIKNYLNKSFLISKKNSNQPIIKALIKYGYEKFLFIIIEYTQKDSIFDRETF
jgi:group I intron endonuclease